MKVQTINNNYQQNKNYNQKDNPSFNAIRFSSDVAKQKFMAALKKQSLEELNEAMNIIKFQHGISEDILISKSAKKNEQAGILNLYAVIDTHVVHAGASIVEFLTACAQKVEALKLASYQKQIKKGLISNKDIKDVIYASAVSELRHSELPKTLSPLKKTSYKVVKKMGKCEITS